ncbi:hypothetical protein MMC25_006583 [Agyrium rufum]|nr:hypothetical protein [Agyrium rufum]
MIATRVLRMQPTHALRLQPTAMLGMRATKPMFRPVPKEEHSAHTISQRIRQLKKVPPELIPLGVVLAVALAAGCYSLINKLFSDKTLRLTRSNRSETFR